MPTSIYTKDDITYFWLEQPTYGTAITAATAMHRADVVQVDANLDLKQRRKNAANRSRILELDNVRHDFKGAAPGMIFEGPVKIGDGVVSPAQTEIGNLLYLACQNVAKSGAGPFTYTFKVPLIQPDFMSSEGIFFTLVKKAPVASRGLMIRDAIAKRVLFRCAAGADDSRLHCVLDMIGRGAPSRAFNYTGTALEVAEKFYYFHDVKVFTGNGQALLPSAIEIEFVLDIEPYSVNVATAGDYWQQVIKKWDINLKFKCLWTTAAHDLALENDDDPLLPRAWIIEWGTAATANYLKLQFNAITLPSPEMETDVREIEFNLACVRDGATEPFTGTLVESFDKTSWP